MLHVRFLTNAQHVFLLFLLNIFILYIFLLTLLLLFAASGAGPAYPVLSSPLSSFQPDLTEQQLPGDSADGPGQAAQPAVPGQSGPNRFCGPVQPGGPAHPAGLQLQVPSTANWGSMKRRGNGGVAEYNAPLSLHTPADPPSIHFDRGSYSAVHNMMCQKD